MKLIRVNSRGRRHETCTFFRSLSSSSQVRVIPPPPPTPPPKPSTAARIFKRHFKSIMILLTTVTVICAITLIALRFVGTKKPSYIPTTTDDESTNTTTNVPPAKTHYFFNMSQWGGRILHNKNLMDEPVQLVIIKHTKSKACQDVPNCFSAMQDMQNSDVGSHHLPDIRYNFVIGGDGNIYEGRGWGVQNEQMNNTIDIAYMGNFNEDIPSEFVVDAGKFLVVNGLFSGHLDVQNITVVCHNQTEKTDSPGENLYKEIILWESYSNKTFNDNDWKNDL